MARNRVTYRIGDGPRQTRNVITEKEGDAKEIKSVLAATHGCEPGDVCLDGEKPSPKPPPAGDKK